jgi:hypothetical protein
VTTANDQQRDLAAINQPRTLAAPPTMLRQHKSTLHLHDLAKLVQNCMQYYRNDFCVPCGTVKQRV